VVAAPAAYDLAVATSCGHCGFRGPLEHKENVVLWVEEEEIEGYGCIRWNHTVGIWWCPACQEPTLRVVVWSSEIDEAGVDEVVYPTRRDNASLPEIVRKRLDAAMKVKKIEPGFYAGARWTRRAPGSRAGFGLASSTRGPLDCHLATPPQPTERRGTMSGDGTGGVERERGSNRISVESVS
jgi:hypothetical protein